MAEQRKVFRIEEMAGGFSPDRTDLSADQAETAMRHVELMAEIKALRAEVTNLRAQPAAAATQQVPISEARKLKIELDVIGEAIKQTKEEIVILQDQGFDSSRITRVTSELGAVVSGTENATNQILKMAEHIEEAARTLAVMLNNNYEKNLVQDIQDRVTQIFEACNFQDLTGQRVSKVVSTLTMVEDHLSRMTEIWNVIERFNAEAADTASGNLENMLNGPKLDGDAGHTTQDDIDKLFH